MNEPATSPKSVVHSFSCALSAMAISHVRRKLGEEGVARLLSEAQSSHDASYLTDVGNWISFDEAIALLRAGEAITQDRHFAMHAGDESIRLLGSSATATVLRSLGSVEEHMRQLKVSAQRYSTTAELDAVEVRPGYAEIHAVMAPGLTRTSQHCDWTIGLLRQATVLFGLAPAQVEHTSCQALGAPYCRYLVRWDASGAGSDEGAQVRMLREQLSALSRRLEGIFATAADLISAGDLNDTLARIADRAAQQVRAPKYVLAVRPSTEGQMIVQAKGMDEEEAEQVARRLYEGCVPPSNWAVAEIRSRHRDYGRLVAMYQEGAQFFPQERELLELYSRYAATALDSATALLEAQSNRDEAQRRHQEASALLELARQLASAGSTAQIASRLVEAIPAVIDCDRVTVSLWDEQAGVLRRQAVNSTGWRDEQAGAEVLSPEQFPQLAAWLKRPDPEPHFIDIESSPIKGTFREIGAVASVAVPIATARRFIGVLQVSVRSDPERLARSPELSDRLAGVAAHAVIALENGRLVDHITHQAHHDQLTGLANRLAFGERIAQAAERGSDATKPFALFYIDLDRFKPINDEFGHEAGDQLLRAVAGRLRNCARPEDTVARLGGDEFAVIVDAIEDPSALEAIAQRFERAFQSPFVIGELRLAVQASIGRAIWPLDATDVEGLLREADATMYRVKRSRPGRSVRAEQRSAADGRLSSPPT
ncbi:MAG TPA: diguanylate cyclase [Solirubrobacteraceae bacterium]|nr:diguanylate cyclase [Solirubrobacteraceae bacterium]